MIAIVDEARKLATRMAAGRGIKNQLKVLAKAVAADNEHDDTREALVSTARTIYADGSDDNIEVDDGAVISVGEDGAWVSAWVWVPEESD